MRGKSNAAGGRRLKRAIWGAAAVALLAIVALSLRSPDARVLLLRAAAVVAALLLGWRMTAALRRSLREQRPEPMQPLERSAPRSARVPTQLLRVLEEVERAGRGGADSAKGLEARLRELERRRALLGHGGQGEGFRLPDPAAGGRRRRAGRAVALRELGAAVRHLEEM